MKNQIKIGSILSYVQMALSIVVGLLYTPLMIKLLGQSEYGLYNTVASTVSMLSILNLGFSSGYIRYYAIYKSEDDNKSIEKLNGLFLIIFLFIGLIAFLCGLFLTTHLNLVFDQGLTNKEYETARVLMMLLTVNLTISFPMSVFTSIINAHERFIFLKLAGMGKTVLSPILTIPLLLLGYGSIGVVLVTVCVSIVVDITYVLYVFVKLKNRFAFRHFEKGIFKSLFTYTVFIALNIIIDQINWNVDKILLGRYQGTMIVAVYSVGAMLQTYYNTFSTAISTLFTPKIHYIVNNVDEQERDSVLTALFIRVGRIQFLILALIISGFIFFGKPFIRFWAGVEYGDSYYVALLLMIPVTVPLIQNLGIEIQRAKNKHQFRSIAYSIMAIVNFILTIFLCQKYGAIGAAIGTSISLVIANGIIMNIYYHTRLGINITRFWKNILRVSYGLVLPIVFGVLMRWYIVISSVTSLLFWIFVYTCIYSCSMWFFGMNKYEHTLILRPFEKIIKRYR